MSIIRTDRRQVVATEVPGADKRMAERTEKVRDLLLEIGRELAAVADAAHFVRRGCASIGEYGARFGLDPELATGLADIARAEEAHPELIEALEESKTDVVRAGLAARILAYPERMRDGDDWVDLAVKFPRGRLAWRVDRRMEEVRQAPQPTCELNLVVSRDAREGFNKARSIASNKAGEALTRGQAFGAIVEDYLDRHDEDRKGSRPRRAPDTKDKPDSRHVPAEVRRAVRARSGRCCEFPGCNHDIWLYLSHIVPHAAGGSREIENILDLCGRHHFMFDAGIIKIVSGDANNPVFEVEGKVISSSRGPPAPDEAASGEAAAGEAAPEPRGKPIDTGSDEPPDMVRERVRWPAPGHAGLRTARARALS